MSKKGGRYKQIPQEQDPTEELANAQAEIERLRTQLEEISVQADADAENSRTKITELTAQNKGFDKKWQESQAKNQELEEQLAEAQQTLEKLRTQPTAPISRDSPDNTSTAEAYMAILENYQLRSENARLKEELAKLSAQQSKHEHNESANEQLEAELKAQYEKALATLRAQHRDKVDELLSGSTDITRELQAANASSDKLLEDLNKASQVNKELSELLAVRESELRTLQRQYDSLVKAIDNQGIEINLENSSRSAASGAAPPQPPSLLERVAVGLDGIVARAFAPNTTWREKQEQLEAAQAKAQSQEENILRSATPPNQAAVEADLVEAMQDTSDTSLPQTDSPSQTHSASARHSSPASGESPQDLLTDALRDSDSDDEDRPGVESHLKNKTEQAAARRESNIPTPPPQKLTSTHGLPSRKNESVS